MSLVELSEGERRVLEAVIRSYVETAEPAGSRALTRRFRLGVSPATIRNTMADLEEKGFLSHPHTSAGRVPTDKAYRLYVDSLMHVTELATADRERLLGGIAAGGSAIESILRRTAQSLGVLTQELGVALGPRLDLIVLTRLELVRVSSEKLLLVLTLQGGTVRTVFIEVRGEIADTVLVEVQLVLNERLAGMSLSEIRHLMIGSWDTVVTTIISASIGVTALSAGLMGWFLKKATYPERAILVAGALLLIKPGLYTDVIGLVLLIFVIVIQKLSK